VIVELSDQASSHMLDVLSGLMDGGSIELLSDDRRRLAVLRLSSPATGGASGGEVIFNKISEEDAALAQGNASRARVLASDGSEIFHCDVGDENSDAVIKLNTTSIFRGGPVRLNSFKLVMP
jgi:hypothetical protein